MNLAQFIAEREWTREEADTCVVHLARVGQLPPLPEAFDEMRSVRSDNRRVFFSDKDDAVIIYTEPSALPEGEVNLAAIVYESYEVYRWEVEDTEGFLRRYRELLGLVDGTLHDDVPGDDDYEPSEDNEPWR